jgi:hypothetical protein
MPTPTLTPSLGGLLSPTPSSNVATSLGQPMFVPTEKKELVNKLMTGGVQVDARFTRHAHIYSPTMVSIELTFENLGSEEVGEIKLGARSLAPGMTVHEFPALLGLQQGERRNATLGVDFNDTTQAARVDLVIGGRAHTVNLACTTGEMLRPLVMPAITFADEQAKLRGMNESGGGVKLPSTACDTKSIIDRIYRAANMLQVPGSASTTLQFAGQTISGSSLMLLTVDTNASSILVNTEKIVLGSMLLKEIKAALEKE